MKRRVVYLFFVCVFFSCILSLTSLAKEKAKGKDMPKPNLAKGIDAISQVRAYLEFYYMETADYPDSLKQLDYELNSLLPRNLKPVVIPKDPATGKSFVYKKGKDGKSYTLSFPSPKMYGLSDNFTLTNTPWGGYAKIAEARKRLFLRTVCYENIKGIATAVEYYAKDHHGKYPKTLKDLIPDYLRRIPFCPVTRKPYEYYLEKGKYVIKCPNPEKHGLKVMEFSSDKGPIVH